MADARVDILLQLRSQIQGLDRSVRALDQFGASAQSAAAQSGAATRRIDSDWSRLGDKLRTQFSGVNLGRALLGGLGIGTSLAVVNLTIDKFASIWKEAKQNAEEMERRSQGILAAMREVSQLRFENFLALQSPEEQRRLRQAQLDFARRRLEEQEAKEASAMRGMGAVEQAAASSQFPALGVSNINVRMNRFEGEKFGGESGMGGRDFWNEMNKRADAAKLKQEEIKKEIAQLERVVNTLDQQINKADQAATEKFLKDNEAQRQRLDRELAGIQDKLNKELAAHLEQLQREDAQLERQAETYRRLADPMRQYKQDLAEIVELKRIGKLTDGEAAEATSRVRGKAVDTALGDFFGSLDDESATMKGGRGSMFDEANESAERLQWTLEHGIYGMLQRVRTEGFTLGAVFGGLGDALLATFTKSISESAAKWMMDRMKLALFNRKLDAAEVAANQAKNTALTGQTVAKAATETAVLTPPATLASITSFGLAAAVGVAALAAVLATSRREYGGQVLAGQPYLVGERRPEIFVPDQSGSIVPSVSAFEAMQRGAGGTAAASGMGPRTLEHTTIVNLDPGALWRLIRDHAEADLVDLAGGGGMQRSRVSLG